MEQFDENTPMFVISVAAELAVMHPQTLRQYDRMGLVVPTRTGGKSRRYTMRMGSPSNGYEYPRVGLYRPTHSAKSRCYPCTRDRWQFMSPKK